MMRISMAIKSAIFRLARWADGVFFRHNPVGEKQLRLIADKYFAEHPDAKDEVMKAYFAYHTSHIREHPGAHNFSGPWRDCECRWCGRTRELVRWDDIDAQCQKRPELPDISDTIRGEEEKAFALIEKAANDVPRLVDKFGMSGNTLAVLHHTHGYDAETVAGVVDVPPRMLSDYHAAMETERERSRSAIVRDVVIARTTK